MEELRQAEQDLSQRLFLGRTLELEVVTGTTDSMPVKYTEPDLSEDHDFNDLGDPLQGEGE